MDDDEDWDAPAKVTSKPMQQSNNATPHQTLKITDGYKYSYEALSSPANIDDWVEAPSYGGSRRSSSGCFQNSFRDNNRSLRHERSNSNKRFDSLKQNDSFSSKSSPRNFSAPKSNRFPNRSLTNAGSANDWDDAPDSSTNQMNGSWKGNANIPVNIVAEEDWDNDDAMTQNHSIPNSADISMYNPNNSKRNSSCNVLDEDENWGASMGIGSNNKTLIDGSQSMSANSANKDKFWNQSSETSAKKKVVPEMEKYNSVSSVRNLEQGNSTNSMEENWDADPLDAPSSNTSRNGFTNDIPVYNPSNSNGQTYSNNPFNQRYENNYHSSKHPHSRNFDSNDRFSREPFNRHSRGNRHSPYERGSRGRGGRGGRGGRSGRDGSYQSYSSRDNSRNRADRRDSSYQHNSYPKNRSSERTSYQPALNSLKSTVVEAEENWDSPSGFIPKPPENNAPPPSVAPVVEQIEESWD